MGSIIQGISIYPLKQIFVPKGDLWHAFKLSDDGYVGFGEAYLTQIHPGKVKGWKRHNRLDLNIVVIQGKVKFVIFDDRTDSATNGQFQEVILSPVDNYKRLTIKAGLWMSFIGLDRSQPSMLIDFIPELYDPNEISKRELNEINYNFNL